MATDTKATEHAEATKKIKISKALMAVNVLMPLIGAWFSVVDTDRKIEQIAERIENFKKQNDCTSGFPYSYVLGLEREHEALVAANEVNYKIARVLTNATVPFVLAMCFSLKFRTLGGFSDFLSSNGLGSYTLAGSTNIEQLDGIVLASFLSFWVLPWVLKWLNNVVHSEKLKATESDDALSPTANSRNGKSWCRFQDQEPSLEKYNQKRNLGGNCREKAVAISGPDGAGGLRERTTRLGELISNAEQDYFAAPTKFP